MINASRQRILRATAASLSWQGRDSDGEPADPGTVTVGVVNSAGTEVIAAGTATSGSTTNPRTVALTVAQTALVDRLTATWKVSGTTVAVTKHDIVGGYYFSQADLRNAEPSTRDTTNPNSAAIIATRAEIESLIESVCNVSFVPRFDVQRIYRDGCHFMVDKLYVRRVAWVRQWTSETAYTDLTAAECAAIPPSDIGRVTVPTWLAGSRYGVEIGYEHGLDAPPYDLKRAVLAAARKWGNQANSGIPDGATFMTLPEGGSIQLATPGTRDWHTGIPGVDEVLMRYNLSVPGVA